MVPRLSGLSVLVGEAQSCLIPIIRSRLLSPPFLGGFLKPPSLLEVVGWRCLAPRDDERGLPALAAMFAERIQRPRSTDDFRRDEVAQRLHATLSEFATRVGR